MAAKVVGGNWKWHAGSGKSKVENRKKRQGECPSWSACDFYCESIEGIMLMCRI
jgi:hypothetical protein